MFVYFYKDKEKLSITENIGMNYTRLYKETQIETASPIRLVIIVYEVIISSIEQALIFMETKKYDLLNKELNRAQDGIIELIASLDMEKGGSIASNLYSIYLYCSKRLFEGNIEKNKDMLIEVRNILQKLKDAWEQIANMNINEKNDDSNSIKRVDIQG